MSPVCLQHPLSGNLVGTPRQTYPPICASQVAEEPHTFWPSVLQGHSTVGLGCCRCRCRRCAWSWPGTAYTWWLLLADGWHVLVLCSCQISAHIPLERLASTFLSGLLHLAHTSGNGEPYVAALQAALSGGGEVQAAETAARQWQMCGLAAERITAWMSQVGQGVAQFGQVLQRRAVACGRLQRCCQFLLCSWCCRCSHCRCCHGTD